MKFMILQLQELSIKLGIFFLYLIAEGTKVFLIFPSEYFNEVYAAYGFLGSLLFTGFTFWWQLNDDELHKDIPVKIQVYKVLLRTILSTFMTFVLLGLLKANFVYMTENTLLTIGVCLGFGFEYYSKRTFVNNIFRNLAKKVLNSINKTEIE